MKFFLDTASLKDISWAAQAGLIDGITTNPTLLSKQSADLDPRDVLKEICSLVEGPVSAEVVAVDTEGMVKEGKELYILLKDMESVFARAGRDQIRIHIHPADMDGLEKFISHLFRRVVMTISGVGMAIVTSLIYVRIGSLVLLGVGLFFSFSLVSLVFLLPNPQRYPFRVRRARKAGRML